MKQRITKVPGGWARDRRIWFCIGGASLIILAGATLIVTLNQAGRAAAIRRSDEARSHYTNGDPQSAFEILLQNERRHRLSTDDALLMGHIALFREQWEQAEHYWQMILDREAYHLDGAKWLTRLYLLTERATEAQQILERLLPISSEDADLLLLFGQAQLAQGDLEGALASFAHALLLGERLAEAALELAAIYQSAGMEERMQQELRRALGLLASDNPLRPVIETRLAQYAPPPSPEEAQVTP